MENFQLLWALSGSWWGKAIIALFLFLLSTFAGNKNFSNFRLCFMPRTTKFHLLLLMFMAIDDYILLGLTPAFFILWNSPCTILYVCGWAFRKLFPVQPSQNWRRKSDKLLNEIISCWSSFFTDKQSRRKWERDFW